MNGWALMIAKEKGTSSLLQVMELNEVKKRSYVIILGSERSVQWEDKEESKIIQMRNGKEALG